MFEGSLEFELPTYGCWKKARDWGGKMREAHVEVKMVKPPQARRAFGTRAAGNARGCGRKHISKPKCEKHTRFGPLLDSFGRSNFSKRMQAWDVWRGSAKMHFAWQAPCKRHLDQTCQEVRALICWERLHSWSIRSSGLLRCVTGAALRMTWSHFFVAGAISTYISIYLSIYTFIWEMEGKLAKLIGTQPSALRSTSHLNHLKGLAGMLPHSKIMRKPRKISSFWSCQLPLLKQVSHNCFLSDK